MATSPSAKSAKAKAPSAKGFDEAAIRGLLEHTLRQLSGDKEAKKAKAAIDEILDFARDSYRADGKEGWSVTGVSVGPGADGGSKGGGSVTVVYDQVGQTGAGGGSSHHGRLVAFGGPNYECRLTYSKSGDSYTISCHRV